MSVASSSTYTGGGSRKGRAASVLLAVAITALVVLLLLRMGLFTPEPRPSSALTTMTLLPGEEAQASRTPKPAPTRRARAAAASAPPKAKAAVPLPPPIVPPPAPTPAWNVMYLSHDEMAAADIGKMPSHRGEQLAAKGDDSGDADASAGGGKGNGDGPGGSRLYDAEWYRRPSRAEMATYMPHLSQPGWGMVACRTIADYRVEDCREIGESPGSHLARAVREAAWQFRVLPPRINGRPVIGAWVRIRFDVSLDGAADAS